MSETAVASRVTGRVRSALSAALFAIAFVLLYVFAILTPEGQQWDAASLGTLSWLRSDAWLVVYGVREWLPFALLAFAAVAGIEAIVRRRWEAVVAAGALVALTAFASVAFKAGVLPRPDLGEFAYSHNTFPSGHTAVSLAAVVAVVWFGPRWLHPAIVVLLGALVGFIAFASLLSFAHRASDIIGGALLVGAFACGISAIVGSPPIGRGGARLVWTLVGLGGVIAGAVFFAIALGVFSAGVADMGAPLDSIGLSVILAVAGVIAIVIANQYPIRGRAGKSTDATLTGK